MITGLIVGLFVGATIGFFAAALMAMAARTSRQLEQEAHERGV